LINVNLLPKNLRRIQEPGYWKLLAVLFPLLTFAIVFTLQFTANQTVRNLENDVQQLEDRLALLQPALREQQQLQQRQAQLRRLITVYEQVRANRIDWTDSIQGMLETLPALSASGSRQIDFRTLNLAVATPPINDPARYEGKPVVAEMTISGNALNTDVLAEFIRTVEDSPRYGVAFQRTTRQEDNGVYAYSLVVGMYQQGAQNEAR
jgi:type IV pilus assembly protein PilN